MITHWEWYIFHWCALLIQMQNFYPVSIIDIYVTCMKHPFICIADVTWYMDKTDTV